MKSILFINLFLLVNFIYSQKITHNFYMPLKTYHYNQTTDITKKYYKTEGGDRGLVYIMRKKKDSSRLYTEFSIGAIRNTFGDFSLLSNIGVGLKWKHIRTSMSLGISTGYKKLYEPLSNPDDRTYMYDIMPKIFRSNNLVLNPMITLISNNLINIDNIIINPLLNISPNFLNTGIIITIKK